MACRTVAAAFAASLAIAHREGTLEEALVLNEKSSSAVIDTVIQARGRGVRVENRGVNSSASLLATGVLSAQHSLADSSGWGAAQAHRQYSLVLHDSGNAVLNADLNTLKNGHFATSSSLGKQDCAQDPQGERVGCRDGCLCAWLEECYPKYVGPKGKSNDPNVGICGPSIAMLVAISLTIVGTVLSCVVVLRVFFQWRDRINNLLLTPKHLKFDPTDDEEEEEEDEDNTTKGAADNGKNKTASAEGSMSTANAKADVLN